MFVIEMRFVTESTYGPWFRIWESNNGSDCADYLRDNVKVECDPHHGRKKPGARKYAEYHMIYSPEESK